MKALATKQLPGEAWQRLGDIEIGPIEQREDVDVLIVAGPAASTRRTRQVLRRNSSISPRRSSAVYSSIACVSVRPCRMCCAMRLPKIFSTSPLSIRWRNSPSEEMLSFL